MAESSTKLSKGIRFANVRAAYPPGEDILLKLVAEKSLPRTSRDWVGIFRVGFASSRDYYTFQWVPLTTADAGKDPTDVSVTFTARSVPAEDGNFYQVNLDTWCCPALPRSLKGQCCPDEGCMNTCSACIP